MMGIDRASLMSPVLGLKDKPRIATRLFCRLPRCFLARFMACCGCVWFTCSTACRRDGSYPRFFEKAISALTSFGKQLPPYPSPEFRKCGLIRLSMPMAWAMVVMSALGIFWQMLAIVLMKLIFVARNALLVYLISSAVATLVLIIGGVLSR